MHAAEHGPVAHGAHPEQGDSDVYLTLVDGEERVQFLLGPEMRVMKSPSLMGDLKASTWEGIFA